MHVHSRDLIRHIVHCDLCMDNGHCWDYMCLLAGGGLLMIVVFGTCSIIGYMCCKIRQLYNYILWPTVAHNTCALSIRISCITEVEYTMQLLKCIY